MIVDFYYRTNYNSAEIREVLEDNGVELTEDGWRMLIDTFPREIKVKYAIDGLGQAHRLG